MRSKKVSLLYMVFTVVFITCLLISNVAAFKMFSMGPVVLTSAVILFPITYIINDLLAEVYGYRAAKRAIFLGFAMNLLMVVFFFITIQLKAPVWFEHSDAYALVLGNTPRLLVASMLAYLVGSTLNAGVLVKMKKSGKGGLFLRCIVSTLIGEFVDSIIFVTLAFIGIIPFNDMLIMIGTQAMFKTAYETVIFPLTSIIVRKVKVMEGVVNG